MAADEIRLGVDRYPPAGFESKPFFAASSTPERWPSAWNPRRSRGENRCQATFNSHGTTVKNTSTGETVWDVQTIEAVQPDGDVTWIAFAERYDEGVSVFKFIGGTGKWYGITGHGRVMHSEHGPLIYDPDAHPDAEECYLPVWEITLEVPQ